MASSATCDVCGSDCVRMVQVKWKKETLPVLCCSKSCVETAKFDGHFKCQNINCRTHTGTNSETRVLTSKPVVIDRIRYCSRICSQSRFQVNTVKQRQDEELRDQLTGWVIAHPKQTIGFVLGLAVEKSERKTK